MEKINNQLGIRKRTTLDIPNSADGNDASYGYAFGDWLKNQAKQHPAIFSLINPIGGAVTAYQNKGNTNGSAPLSYQQQLQQNLDSPPISTSPSDSGTTDKTTTSVALSTPAKIGIGVGVIAIASLLGWGIVKLIKHHKKSK